MRLSEQAKEQENRQTGDEIYQLEKNYDELMETIFGSDGKEQARDGNAEEI